jgi:hypothetical protein
MREFTNLAWPASPYSTAHRPVQRPMRLLTGLAIGASGWAAVHLPAHRTRTLDAAQARLGIHAVLLPRSGIADGTVTPDSVSAEVSGWLVLDRLLLAARRQAAAIAGDGLGEDLARVAHRVTTCGYADCPGVAALLPEWPAYGSTPARAVTGHAQLLELDSISLADPAAKVLARYAHPELKINGTEDGPDDGYLTALVARAAAIALAAASVNHQYNLDPSLNVLTLLDVAAGDLLAFTDAIDITEPPSGPGSRPRGARGADSVNADHSRLRPGSSR